MIFFKNYFFFLLFSLNIFFLQAQEDTTTTENKARLIPLPAFVIDPAIGVGFGASLNLYHQLGNPKDTRTSFAQLFGMYTTNNQLVLSFEHFTFTNKEKFFLSGIAEYRRFPLNVYGLGGRTPETAEELIDYESWEISERVLMQIRPNWFMGLQYRYFQVSDVSSETEPIPANDFFQYARAASGFASAGIGFHTFFDNRDNVLNPYRGVFLEFVVDVYPQFLGSTQEYIYLRNDWRAYKMLRSTPEREHILAGRIYSEFTFGEAPYLDMPQTGFNNTTRGYVLARYRGENFITAELEYRARFSERIGLAGFINVHSVSEPVTNEFTYLNPAAGLGLRLMFNRQDRVNVRLDYAVGVDGNSGIYFILAEAF